MDQFKIIPVNITAGAAGGVLVTLKSEKSIPPYRLENRCKDVVIYLRQALEPKAADGVVSGVVSGVTDVVSGVTDMVTTIVGASPTSPMSCKDAAALWDTIPPEGTLPFAWDAPTMRHMLTVHIALKESNQSPGHRSTIGAPHVHRLNSFSTHGCNRGAATSLPPALQQQAKTEIDLDSINQQDVIRVPLLTMLTGDGEAAQNNALSRLVPFQAVAGETQMGEPLILGAK